MIYDNDEWSTNQQKKRKTMKLRRQPDIASPLKVSLWKREYTLGMAKRAGERSTIITCNIVIVWRWSVRVRRFDQRKSATNYGYANGYLSHQSVQKWYEIGGSGDEHQVTRHWTTIAETRKQNKTKKKVQIHANEMNDQKTPMKKKKRSNWIHRMFGYSERTVVAVKLRNSKIKWNENN